MVSNNFYVESMQTILYVVLTAIVPILGSVIKKYFETLIQEKTNKIQDARTKQLILQAEEVVSKVVTSVGQTYVDGVKKAGNGKLDKDTQTFAKNLAMSTAISLISAESKEAISQAYSTFDTWLDTAVENAVAENK